MLRVNGVSEVFSLLVALGIADYLVWCRTFSNRSSLGKLYFCL